MSLDWSTTDCDPPLPKDSDDAALRNTLTWAAVAVDLGSITEKNIDEWLFRLYFLEEPGMGYISLGLMTMDDVRAGLHRWIGLSTNVTTLTRKQWIAKQAKIIEDRVVRKIKKATAPV